MTKPKARALGPSGPGALVFSDGDVLPDMPSLRDDLAGTAVDAHAFGEWLRQHLADYRINAQARQSMAQKAAVVAWLKVAASDVGAALADGRLRKLPVWFAEPAVHHAAVKAGMQWRACLASADQVQIARVLLDACASLERQRSNRGRPSESERDKLLHLVVEQLKTAGLPPAEAQHRADAILVRCQVPSPEASVSRAARRGRGAISV